MELAWCRLVALFISPPSSSPADAPQFTSNFTTHFDVHIPAPTRTFGSGGSADARARGVQNRRPTIPICAHACLLWKNGLHPLPPHSSLSLWIAPAPAGTHAATGGPGLARSTAATAVLLRDKVGLDGGLVNPHLGGPR
ncbi:hypothetical protein CONPUDRAFT_162911 [Coniophora puteana RWD-64-598 SS2]|uniref:Uncharacterized protein n=1 Tax=Coniophora puteana (strain RWD-64-598) TaxID=741705 RepID=A0A5M3N481_CONPW|nr:uncharacterized protein CONPUDRAFT_162911 [Coniophora puteana RWD-64-598 SS2]EIW85844.1 hypothetical protein CONPUDRAFT_162911 [Coniophora puteana RWD-64-598 SS2]